MMALQQPTTFGPFMGQFVVFGRVAMRAGDDKIFGPIRTAATQRDDMIYMVSIIEFFAAPIAFAFLSLVLGFNVSLSVLTFGIAYEGTTALLANAMLVFIGGMISAISIEFPFLVCLVARAPEHLEAFPIGRIPSATTFCIPLLMGFAIGTFALRDFFLIGLTINTHTLSQPFSIGDAIGMSARFTSRLKSVALALVSRKVFGCCGLCFATLGATLKRYGRIIHSKVSLIDFAQARDILKMSPGAFYWFAPVSIARNGAFNQ